MLTECSDILTHLMKIEEQRTHIAENREKLSPSVLKKTFDESLQHIFVESLLKKTWVSEQSAIERLSIQEETQALASLK